MKSSRKKKKDSLDALLNMVDEWKFKAQELRAKMTPEERAAHSKRILDECRAKGWSVIETPPMQKPKKKRRPRKTG